MTGQQNQESSNTEIAWQFWISVIYNLKRMNKFISFNCLNEILKQFLNGMDGFDSKTKKKKDEEFIAFIDFQGFFGSLSSRTMKFIRTEIIRKEKLFSIHIII